MTCYLLAGGGTAGHVNPLLAVADRLRELQPDAQIFVVGTAEGLEAHLVPARGYDLLTIDKVPLPRRPGLAMLRFPARFRRAVQTIRAIIAARGVDVVVGFGGFVSAPAYLAARRQGVPMVVHEANAVPGFANRLGSWLTSNVGVAFEGTKLRHARFVGMPMTAVLENLDRTAVKPTALEYFGLASGHPTLLVTGGSQGAQKINETLVASEQSILDGGWNILHIAGGRSELSDQGSDRYRLLKYCDRMDLVFSVADFAIARAGSATVSELSALGIPAAYVPLPIGNGEQRRNAKAAVEAGGAIEVDNADFTTEWVGTVLLPLLRDSSRLATMSSNLSQVGVSDGTARTVELVLETVRQSGGVR